MSKLLLHCASKSHRPTCPCNLFATWHAMPFSPNPSSYPSPCELVSGSLVLLLEAPPANRAILDGQANRVMGLERRNKKILAAAILSAPSEDLAAWKTIPVDLVTTSALRDMMRRCPTKQQQRRNSQSSAVLDTPHPHYRLTVFDVHADASPLQGRQAKDMGVGTKDTCRARHGEE